MYKVYIHHFPNNKVYIGITKLNISDRWREGKGYKTQILMYRAIQKYGWDNIKHEVVFDNLTQEEAEQKEKELIQKYKSNDSEYGYNIESGGNSKGKMSEAEKKKRSERFRGKNNPMSGVRRFGAENPMYGKKWTDEQKKAHSEKIKGRFCGDKNPMYGKKHSAEELHKMSVRNIGSKNPNSKKVRCIETGKIYNCINDAAIEMKTSPSNLSSCLRGFTRTAAGFNWEYFGGQKNEMV